MFIVNLLIPFTMIGFGIYFIKSAGPKNINMLFGYRTPMSMKNNDTWEFAHVYCGNLWRRIGLIMLPVSAIAMFFLIGKENNIIEIFALVIMGVQLVFLILPIIPTEMALRKNFDKYGERRFDRYGKRKY